MKIALDWFATLNPTIQAVAIISLCALLMVVVLNKDASANFVSIMPWILCLFGSSNSSANAVTEQPKTVAENFSNKIGGQKKKT